MLIVTTSLVANVEGVVWLHECHMAREPTAIARHFILERGLQYTLVWVPSLSLSKRTVETRTISRTVGNRP